MVDRRTLINQNTLAALSFFLGVVLKGTGQCSATPGYFVHSVLGVTAFLTSGGRQVIFVRKEFVGGGVSVSICSFWLHFMGFWTLFSSLYGITGMSPIIISAFLFQKQSFCLPGRLPFVSLHENQALICVQWISTCNETVSFQNYSAPICACFSSFSFFLCNHSHLSSPFLSHMLAILPGDQHPLCWDWYLCFYLWLIWGLQILNVIFPVPFCHFYLYS